MSPLRKALQDYLALRRSLGFKLHKSEGTLRHFVDFMERKRACEMGPEMGPGLEF
ncbi:MAG: hypothetical protein AABZ85_00975 [Thermodesulfobacteriota bacterium]